MIARPNNHATACPFYQYGQGGHPSICNFRILPSTLQDLVFDCFALFDLHSIASTNSSQLFEPLSRRPIISFVTFSCEVCIKITPIPRGYSGSASHQTVEDVDSVIIRWRVATRHEVIQSDST